jgi:DNA polymerase III subunit beta
MLVLKSSKDALLKPLQAVAGVVERKHTFQSSPMYLLEVLGGRVAFIATDLELQISTWIEDGSAADAAFTVSARKLLDISRSLQDVETISLDLNNDQLKVQSGRSRFNLQTLPARDFPKLQIPEGQGLSFSLPQGLLKQLLSACAIRHGGAGHPLLPERHAVLDAGQTADRGRNRRTRLAVDGTEMGLEMEQGVDVILPRKTVLELGKLLSDSEDPVHIQVNQNQVVFQRPDFELRSKVVDGKFPDWQRVVPVGHDKCFAFSVSAFAIAEPCRDSDQRQISRRSHRADASESAHCLQQQRAGRSPGRTGHRLPGRAAGYRFQHPVPAGCAEQPGGRSGALFIR